MNKTLIAIVAYLIGFGLVTFLFWLGGENFNERGIVTVLWFALANYVGISASMIFYEE